MKKLRSMNPPFDEDRLSDDLERWLIYKGEPAPPDRVVGWILVGGAVFLTSALILFTQFV